MRNNSFPGLTVFIALLFVAAPNINAEVKTTADDGIAIEHVLLTRATPGRAYQHLIEDLAEWWDPNHSYSGKSENLSMDLDRACFLEKLEEGGFVRHMEIVYHQPGKLLRLTGGLGPLQRLGVSGTLDFKFEELNGQTRITLSYVVAGSSLSGLQPIAPAIDGVLGNQLQRLVDYANQQLEEK